MDYWENKKSIEKIENVGTSQEVVCLAQPHIMCRVKPHD
jgi:hypothetical protein